MVRSSPAAPTASLLFSQAGKLRDTEPCAVQAVTGPLLPPRHAQLSMSVCALMEDHAGALTLFK